MSCADLTLGLVVYWLLLSQSADGVGGFGRASDREAVQRVLKHFDFDERQHGNLESIPMLWTRHEARGFPEFIQGSFDFDNGHQSPPSFYLPIDGKNCGYHYRGLDIRAEPPSDYRVVAFVRPDRLRHARAYLSAALLDANGRVLSGTQQRSNLVGGDPARDDWQEVSVQLAGNLDAAFFLSVSVWVVQRAQWTTAPVDGQIDYKDIAGGAWFDDISIYRLPTVSLTSQAEDRGHVFLAHEKPTLRVRVGDVPARSAKARLTVWDAAGAVVVEQLVHTTPDTSETVELEQLPVGRFRARLSVAIGRHESIDRHLEFARLGPRIGSTVKSKHRYGVILDSAEPGDWAAYSFLVDALGVRHVKLRLPAAGASAYPSMDWSFERFVEHQADSQNLVTGIFSRVRLNRPGPDPPSHASLVDLLLDDPAIWRPVIAQTVTKYESLFGHWQVGSDGDLATIEDRRFGSALNGFRSEMSVLTTVPIIVAPWIVHHEPGVAALPADILSVSVPQDVLPEDIPHYVAEIAQAKTPELWLVLERPEESHYKRLPLLADFAKRVLYAHQSGTERVFVTGPWKSRSGSNKTTTEPEELYLLYRTIVSLLDDATFVGEVELGDDITCLAFDVAGTATLAVWDEAAPLHGRPYNIHLYGARQAVDLWGRSTTLATAEQQLAEVTLSPVPVFFLGAETWLIKFRQGLRFEPSVLPSEQTFHEQSIQIHNPRQEPISGLVRLKIPEGWQIRPAQFTFAAQPNQTISKNIRLQPAPREPAGSKTLLTQVTLDSTRRYQFDVWLPLRLDLTDMDVWAEMMAQPDVLVIRHGVTNSSTEAMSFISVADAPGRKRRNLNIVNLQPGQTVLRSHYFRDPQELTGKEVRIGLKQVKGPRTHNLSITVP